MLTRTKCILAAALALGTASAALAGKSGYVAPDSRAGVNPVHHLRPVPNHAGARKSYAFAPSGTRNRAIAPSAPWSGCDHVFNYDRAMNGYTYDLVCNGVDLTSRAGVSN
jgi:hypothetical protein